LRFDLESIGFLVQFRMCRVQSTAIQESRPPGVDGFLGSRASLGTDLVFVALFGVLPLLAWGIQLARRRQYRWHKTVQLTIAAALLVAITIFEIDMRFVSGWKPRAVASPWWPGVVWTTLGVHLCFAISTLVLWVWVVWEAIRRFPVPAAPAAHSARHRIMGRLAAADLFLTSVTGWIFYWVAFVAS
jgi:putative membrane protein